MDGIHDAYDSKIQIHGMGRLERRHIESETFETSLQESCMIFEMILGRGRDPDRFENVNLVR